MSSVSDAGLPESLLEALKQSREWGFLGEGPVETHIAHALGFAAAAESLTDVPGDGFSPGLGMGRWMDLGSGGGIPGLVLAHRWSDSQAVLLDSNERRTRFLSQVVEDEGWGDRVEVVSERAELAGRAAGLRGAFSLVVSRSFGSPPVTAECSAPFLRQGGALIVSEPPISGSATTPDSARWPESGLATVGLTPSTLWRGAFSYVILRQLQECPDRFPRRVGVPGKRPIYRVGGD